MQSKPMDFHAELTPPPSGEPSGEASPARLLERRARHVSPWVKHFYEQPPEIVRGELQYLFDHRGRRYLDCFSGVAAVNAGHSHPAIRAAAHEAVDTLQHTTTIYLTRPIVDLAEALARVSPGDLDCTFFTTSGSEANESATLLASTATGRREFIALANGLHGRTKMAMSLTGLSFWRADAAPVGGVHFAPPPNCFRCPLGRTYPDCELACARAVEDVITTATSGEPAAFIAEPVQGNGGIVDPPPGYFEVVREILDRYGALLIADEVQTGFGRTGRFFGMEHHAVTPDILTSAKGLGNGFPIGAMISRRELASASTRPGASTLGGSPFTATVALAVVELHERERLAERARDLGAHFKQGLRDLQDEFDLIGDVRGKGLMLGAELIVDGKQPATAQTDRILESMKDRGIFIGKTGPGRNVLTFLPPLIIERSDIDTALDALRECLEEVSWS